MYRLVFILLICIFPCVAFAQDEKECFSEYTKYNICEKAREIHVSMQSLLPMKMNNNITISTATVIGPRLALVAVWNLNKAEVEETLKNANMQMSELEEKMRQMTFNAVCSQNNSAAFVRLRGQIQYSYMSKDGHFLFSPVITSCPK